MTLLDRTGAGLRRSVPAIHVGHVPPPAPTGRWDPALAVAESARRLLVELRELIADTDLEDQ